MIAAPALRMLVMSALVMAVYWVARSASVCAVNSTLRSVAMPCEASTLPSNSVSITGNNKANSTAERPRQSAIRRARESGNGG